MMLKELFMFLGKNKKFIYFALSFVIISVVIMSFLPISNELKNNIFFMFKNYIWNMAHMSWFDLAWHIFLNNSFVGLIILLWGFIFSLPAVIIVLINSFVIVVISSLALWKIWIEKTILTMLPHWIFEISAIILCIAMSFKISYLLYKKLRKKEKIYWELKEVFVFFLLFIIPMFFVAAMIESFITPLLIK